MSAGNSLFGKIRAQFEALTITTADDTGTAGTPGGQMVEVFEGTGSNYVRSLPAANASGMFVGWSRHFVNASSETVIVKNSGAASSLMVWLMPGETLDVLCTSIADAAGAWHAQTSNAGPQYISDDIEDFIAVNSVGSWKIGLHQTVIGSGATVTAGSAVSTVPCGRAAFLSGTDANSRAALSTGLSALIFGQRPFLVEMRGVGFNALSDGSVGYTADLGFGSSATDAEHTSGVLFRYNSASANWQCVAVNAGTAVPVATDIAVVADDVTLRVAVASDASRADFWINFVHAGTISSDIPTAHLGWVAKIVKTAGSGAGTSRTMYLDWLRIRSAGARQ